MNRAYKLVAWGCAAMLSGLIPVCFAADSTSLMELLKQVQEGRIYDSEENAERISRFENELGRRQQMLTTAEAEQNIQEQRSQELEQRFEENEQRIIEAREALHERLGELKELYGVLQSAAGDAGAQFQESMTSLQFSERTEFLEHFAQRMGRETRPPSLADIERLWFELQREMIESGRVVRISIPIADTTGELNVRLVTRVGLFNLVADGKYLEHIPETGRVVEPPRQPGARFTALVQDLETANDGLVPFGLDPSRGRLLSLLIQKPDWREHIEQGGIVGYLILALGALALLIAFERLLSLSITGVRVHTQAHNLNTPGNNPLGRVLKVYHDNPSTDLETLELRLVEVILKEKFQLQRRLTFLKIIAVIAPLMGLLGTVVGMIITFQSIALFGTGDPKLMAGGISQALVTTVMGLCVAIPTVLLHTLVSDRARRLAQLLEEQATGMIAEQAERTETNAAAMDHTAGSTNACEKQS